MDRGQRDDFNGSNGEGGGGGWKFEPVPPPAKAPVQELAESLGVCVGLRVEKSLGGQWRCACCSRMQPAGTWLVWVPDSVRRGDPSWSVTEAARVNAFNGHSSGWCLSCAPKTPRPELSSLSLLPPLAKAGFLSRLFRWA